MHSVMTLCLLVRWCPNTKGISGRTFQHSTQYEFLSNIKPQKPNLFPTRRAMTFLTISCSDKLLGGIREHCFPPKLLSGCCKNTICLFILLEPNTVFSIILISIYLAPSLKYPLWKCSRQKSLISCRQCVLGLACPSSIELGQNCRNSVNCFKTQWQLKFKLYKLAVK